MSALPKGNPEWRTETSWGLLEITINTAKPEKDPRDIARAASGLKEANGCAARNGDSTDSCPLCVDAAVVKAGSAAGTSAVGVASHGAAALSPAGMPSWAPGVHAPFSTVQLAGERWFLHYSPYAYCHEHLIVTSGPHRPMRIDRRHMACLLDFVRQFPGYFLGSNADLPIVGGSLLAHDHFQGGCHTFPLMNASIVRPFRLKSFPQIKAGVVHWPVSVIRVQGADAPEVLDAAACVLSAWRSWNDVAAGIVSHSADGTPHNTVTPIAYRAGNDFVLDLALRCNITSCRHPLGVFHPHERLHHIKKENIGLIEVMGRAILPGRLERELAAVSEALSAVARQCSDSSGGGALADETLKALSDNPLTATHAKWAREIVARHDLAHEDIPSVVRRETGLAFAQVLADCGVFMADAAGRAACNRFLQSLGAIY